jgi:hypothetical protein
METEMPDREVVVSSTSDSQEDVNIAAGLPPEGIPEVPPKKETVEGKAFKEIREKKTDLSSNAQKRIDKLTLRANEAERQLAELKQQVESGKEKKIEQLPETPSPEGRPGRAQFKSDDEWIEAVAKWTINKERQAETAREQEEELRANFDAHIARVNEAKEKYDDWDEASEEAHNIPVAVYNALIEMENSGEIMYYLAKHPEVCDGMTATTQYAALRELGKIEAQLAAPPVAAKPKTNAPPPITPGGRGATRTSRPLDDPEVGYQEYKKRRAAGES